VRNLARLKHHLTLSCLRLKMQQDIRIMKQKCNAAMIALFIGQFGEVGPCTPEKALSVVTYPLKLHAKTC